MSDLIFYSKNSYFSEDHYTIGTSTFTGGAASASRTIFFDYIIPTKISINKINVAVNGNGLLYIKKFTKSADGSTYIFKQQIQIKVVAGINNIEILEPLSYSNDDIIAVFTVANIKFLTGATWSPYKYESTGLNVSSDILTSNLISSSANLLISFEVSTLLVANRGNVFDREESRNTLFLDDDYTSLLYYDSDEYRDALGRRKYAEPVGLNFKWEFKGSLGLDDVSKSTGFTSGLISEMYDSGNSYTVDMGLSYLAYLQFDNPKSLNSFNFSMEIFEFELTRFSSNSAISSIFCGQTLYSRKLAHTSTFYPGNGGEIRILEGRMETQSFTIGARAYFPLSPVIGQEFRIVQKFNGRTIFFELYQKAGQDYKLLSNITFSYGDGENRPSNRKLGIMLYDVGVKITKYENYSFEPLVTRLLFIGDSIQSGFSCSDFSKSYTRLASRWNGIAGSVRSGHGCTTDDFMPMIPEILERKPEVVILGLGLNDIRYGVIDYQLKYKSIVDQLYNIGTKVILCNLIPNNVDDVLPFNTWQQVTFGADYIIVNYYDLMKDPSNPTKLNPLYSTDGTHPNDYGNLLMFNRLKQYL
ncbi:SGNH/GDSL hydrolase family protein [Albibacterium bauzanense]|uniref:Lysophospholipase L1-like esterase n=1 Tax=Albibacterium bauzanense TaxID=653929 RepID=A0A4R1M5B8_9SPHI|nr:SGNH/GDSL hydrolase family protein [Albibacterium bauzanense]TCK84899.1 lysophospholipase L1-like esterase [Albibacterium bauzanense]